MPLICESTYFVPVGPYARYLDNDAAVSGAREMRHAGRLGIKTARSEGLEFLFVEAWAVADIPRSRNHGCHAIIRMVM